MRFPCPAGYPSNRLGNLYDYVYGRPNVGSDPYGLVWNWRTEAMPRAEVRCTFLCNSRNMEFYYADIERAVGKSKLVAKNRRFEDASVGTDTL